MGGIPHKGKLSLAQSFILGKISYSSINLQVDVPKDRILLGAKGSTSSRFIMKLAREAVRQDLLGIMVWYCSVQNGLKYAETWDTTGREDSMAGFVEAMDLFKNA